MAVIFTDNFTGTVNTPLNARTASGGGVWQCFGVAAADIAGLKINAANQAKIGTANGCLARAEMGAADHYAKATVFGQTPTVAVTVRATDNTSFVGLRVASSTSIELFKRSGVTETSIVKVTGLTLGLSTVLQLVAVGSTATLFVNGAPVGLAGGYAIDLLGVTRAGLWAKASALDPVADDFEGGIAVTTLVIARGRSGVIDRNVGLAPAAGLSTLAPTRGRLGLLDRQVAVTTAFALAPARARSMMVDRGAGLTPLGALLPARARSGLTDRSVAVAWTVAVGPARSASAQRTGMAGLGLTFAVAPARAVHSERAGAGALGVAGRIAPDGGRLAKRAGAGALTQFTAGVVTKVSADPRTTQVWHD